MVSTKVIKRVVKESELESIWVCFCSTYKIMEIFLTQRTFEGEVLYQGEVGNISEYWLQQNGIDVDNWDHLVNDYEEEYCVVIALR